MIEFSLKDSWLHKLSLCYQATQHTHYSHVSTGVTQLNEKHAPCVHGLIQQVRDVEKYNTHELVSLYFWTEDINKEKRDAMMCTLLHLSEKYYMVCIILGHWIIQRTLLSMGLLEEKVDSFISLIAEGQQSQTLHP